MTRLPLAALAVTVLALATACGGAPRVAPPSPTVAPDASPTAAFTPLAPLPAELIDPASLAKRSGGFVFDVESGELWWLRDRGGDWSPSGDTLLVTGCCVGAGGVELIEFPGGAVSRLYYGDVAAADWSPDGRRIAFSTHEDGPRHLYVVNRDGTGLRKLPAAAGERIAWSPAGGHIAVSTGTGFGVIDMVTGRFTIVTDVDAWAWSPDGRSLALANAAGLSVYDIGTGDRRQIARGHAYGPIVWSPDGSRILLPFGEQIPLRQGPYASTPEAGVPPRLVFSLEEAENPVSLGAVRSVAWSPDGARIAYVSEGCITGEWDIFVTAADGADPRRLTNTPDAFKEGPDWSPDGTSIAYAAYGEVSLVNVETGKARSLIQAQDGHGFHLHGSGWSGRSAWSATGRYLQVNAGGGHGVCD